MSEGSNVKFSEAEALAFHSDGPARARSRSSPPSRWRRSATSASLIRPASPCRCARSPRIPATAYDYTAKGNLVAVISNGTAILGLGNLGALASKPVMEGKAVLFKRFADVDSIDIELDTEDPDKFIEAVALMEPSFGGINLEDIAAPECFIIEQTLRERMNIPVMHDDQHGTAIISRRRPDQRLLPDRPRAQGHQGGGERRRRRRDRLHRADQGDGRAARQCHHVRPQGRDLPGPRRARPVEVGPCGEDRRAHAGGGAGGRRRLPRPFGRRRAEARNGQGDGAPSRSSSRWPIPIRRSPRPTPRRRGPTRSSPPAARIIPTRSTTCSASPSSSAARSTCGRRRSTTR